MGALLGRNRSLETDPFYTAVPPLPPPAPNPVKYTGGGTAGIYNPTGGYGMEYEPTMSIGSLYGQPFVPPPKPYGGRYAQGTNQLPGTGPWNYGNYYLGNTTMQMMPMMLNKVAKYGEIQARALLGNAGLLGPMPNNQGALNLPSAPMIPSPMCCPSAMQMSAPMMAAASPLPIAFSPLVQGMYPVATLTSVNWLSPSSFMSALTSGPMPYRPPGFDFPSNVNMVMAIPYGTPNPFLSVMSSPSFGYPNNSSFGSPTFCCPSMAATAAPAFSSPASYYPCPCSMGQTNSASNFGLPAGLPLIHHIKDPLPISALGSSNMTGVNQPSTGSQLWSSQGAFRNTGIVQPPVMSAKVNLSTDRSTNNQVLNGSLPVYDAKDNSQVLIGQRVLPSISSNNSASGGYGAGSTVSTSKYENLSISKSESLYDRFRRHLPSISRLSSASYSLAESAPRSDPVLPPILNGYLISDTGWLPKSAEYQTVSSGTVGKKRKRLLYSNDVGKSQIYSLGSQLSFIPRRRRRHHSSSSSVSEYDCAICQQQREKRRLNEYYSSSTVSSLLSSIKNSNHAQQTSSDSFLSPKHRAKMAGKKTSHKSHRRHQKKIKNSAKQRSPSPKRSLSPKRTPSPKPRRQSPIQEEHSIVSINKIDEKVKDTHEEEEKEEVEANDDDEKEEEEQKEQRQNRVQKSLTHDNEDLSSQHSDLQGSQYSLSSNED